MLGTYNLYENDITIVKQCGNKLKVIHIASCRKSGFESPYEVKKNSVNEFKLSNNISRAKSKIYELALCNDWEYFVTLTISPKKYDRYNLKAYYKDLSEFLHNFNRRRTDETKVKYLLIPELHQDGAWHMHGLIKGLNTDELYINSNNYYGWKPYEDKFGFLSLGNIRDQDRTASYITKYITKDTEKSVKELGCHLFYSSNGLNVAEQLYRGNADLLCDWDFEHPDGYCKIKTFDIRTDDYTKYLKLR